MIKCLYKPLITIKWLKIVNKLRTQLPNQIAKAQSHQYSQSISNFQVEYLEATNKVIQNVSDFQSTFLENNWNNSNDRSASYAEQFRNQVNTLAENFVKTFNI
jgi:hypothetical protein